MDSVYPHRDRAAEAAARRARNPDTLRGLAEHPDIFVQEAVARNRHTPADVLTRLAEPANGSHRTSAYLAAGNPNTPLDTLTRLAADPYPGLRAAVIGNPNTPHPALAALVSDPEPFVRIWLAANRKTPADVLALLAGDTSSRVRKQLAENPNTPTHVLAELAAGQDADLHAAASGNPTTPPAILTRLAENGTAAVRRKVATNPATPDVALAILADPGRCTPAVNRAARREQCRRAAGTLTGPAGDIARQLLPGWTGTATELLTAAAGINAEPAQTERSGRVTDVDSGPAA